MTPAEFRALSKGADAARSVRTYRALAEGSSEAFLTLHTKAGRAQSFAYTGLSFFDGDEPGSTAIRLILSKISVLITGRQLLPVFESIRSRKAAHLYEFDGGRCDPPQPGQPVIIEIGFSLEQGKPISDPVSAPA